jgi:hypothetical protein
MDSTGRLQLRFEDDGDGTGKLLAQASANGFSGKGAAWFSHEEIKEFADACGRFPISGNDKPNLRGGFFKKDGSGTLDQEHLALSIYPIDSRGHLAVQVRLATEVWDLSRSESQHLVQLEIITSYEPLLRFSRELRALADGKRSDVILDGELLP